VDGVAESIERWRAQGERVVLATVVATRRSAPRPVGARLAVSERGELAGSVSGGCVEPDLAERAREIFASGRAEVVTYGIEDETAWGIGLPCGGEIDVLLAPSDSPLPEAEEDERALRLTPLEGEDAGRPRLVHSGEDAGTDELIRRGRPGVEERPGGRVFYEPLAPPPRLVIFGAVDLAEALCRAAALLGWRSVVVDARPGLATPERVPSAGELLVAWPDDAIDQLVPDVSTAVVVLTHEERFDVPALAGALASDAFYVGALGSRRTQARRRERLKEAGVDEEQLARIAGPAGLDLGAETPAETALSILAEIVAAASGREGGRLAESDGRIHAERGT
jgi:xanthine dehydrogenase accessory factor